jgi:hypothetical protein
MLATLMTMSPGGQAPFSCEADSLGVTIRLGDRVHFFVELPRVCDLDAPDEGAAARPLDVPDLLQAVLASGDIVGTPDAETEPQANVAVSAEDESAETAAADANATEEAVTLRQIAALDAQDFEAAPDQSSQTASAEDATASAADEDGDDEEQPAAIDATQTQEVAPARDDAASADTESVTGPAGLGLVSNDRQLWIDRFDRVREEVRDAFRSLLP